MLFGDCHHEILLTPYELNANIFARNALQLTFFFKIYTFHFEIHLLF